jgi:hypothetical protein
MTMTIAQIATTLREGIAAHRRAVIQYLDSSRLIEPLDLRSNNLYAWDEDGNRPDCSVSSSFARPSWSLQIRTPNRRRHHDQL